MSLLTPIDSARSWWSGWASTVPQVHWHDGGSGPALVMLNGWTASGVMWPDALIQDLERRFRVIRIDNRGTGWSRTAVEGYSITDMAADAAEVLRFLHVKRATVLGLSMGGMIAQDLAARRPDLVDRLLLVGTRPPTPLHVPGNPAELHAALRPRGADESWPHFIRSIWARQLGAGTVGQRREHILDEIVAQSLRRTTPRAGMLGQARAVAAWSNSRRQLSPR